MNKTKFLLVASSLVFVGCSSKPVEPTGVKSTSMLPVISNEMHLKKTIINDYNAYQQVNYDTIKSNNSEDQLTLLNSQVEYVVMDLISNLDERLIDSPIIIRPVLFNVDESYKTRETEILIESGFELTLKRFGFDVFNDRNPRGKLNGNECVLDITVTSINDKVILLSTLKYLDSNKIRAVKQIYISDYFFKEFVDGIEVRNDIESDEEKPEMQLN